MPNYSINKLNIAQIFFLLFLASLFFPIRHVFLTPSAYQTGTYSDFTSFRLYLSDIFLFLTWCFCFLPRGGASLGLRIKDKGLLVLVFWLILGVLWHFKTFSSLNWWFLTKYLELIVAYGTTAYLFSKTLIKSLFFKAFAVFGTLESIIALIQFYKNSSLGLKRLGEQVLGANGIGIAKIVVNGAKYIRGYGTFPHPNLLSAFLVTSIFILIYLFSQSTKFWLKFTISVALFVNILGLTVTFSRAAYVALGIGLIIYFGYLCFSSFFKKRALGGVKMGEVMVIMIVSIITSFFIFRPYLLTRTTISDQSTIERKYYNLVGLKMIKANPLFGVGIGESVLHMEQYAGKPLKPWEKQPAHNYFILAADELGIPGTVILLWIFLSHLYAISYKLKAQFTTYNLLLTTILCSFFVLMQFDHYFYTLQQTQMILWVILGIISAQTKNPQTGDLSKT